MRKVGIFIFILISALALIVVVQNSRPFDPGVNLPEINAGKPFTKWHGIVVTHMPDGQILVDGKVIRTDVIKEVEDALKSHAPQFNELSEKVRQKLPLPKLSAVPVLLCIDRMAKTDVFFEAIKALYRAGCANIYVAGKGKQTVTALSLCSPCGSIDAGWQCFWHEELSQPIRKIQEVRARAEEEGKFRITSQFYSWWTWEKPIVILKEEIEITKEIPRGTSFDQLAWRNPSTVPATDRKGVKVSPTRRYHDSIEPLFEMIEEHKDKNVTVLLDLLEYSNNLTWEWLVKLLVRLEKTNIKGYAFAGP